MIDPEATPLRAAAIRTVLATSAVAALLLVPAPAQADHWDPGGNFDDGDVRDLPSGENLLADGASQVIYPPTAYRADNRYFGTAVDANGDAATLGHTMAVAAPGGEDIFVYRSNSSTDGWAFTEHIAWNGETENEQAVSIDGDTLVATLPGFGEIHVYKRTDPGKWTQTTTLNQEATAVEVDGDLLAWAAPSGSLDDEVPTYGIFERSSTGDWTEVVHEKTGSDANDRLSVGIQESDADTSQSRAVFGGSGIAVVWETDLVSGAWSHAETIDSCGTDGTCRSSFGKSVDLAPTTEDKIAVGAPDRNDQVGRGYTYVNSDGSYVFAGKLEAPDEQESRLLGHDINAWDGSSVAGAPFANTPGGTADVGYVYAYEDGVRTGRVQQAETSGGDHFGSSVHYAGEWMLGGAHWEDAKGYSDLGYVGYFK